MNKKSMGLTMILIPFLALLIKIAPPIYNWEHFLLIACLAIGCSKFTDK